MKGKQLQTNVVERVSQLFPVLFFFSLHGFPIISDARDLAAFGAVCVSSGNWDTKACALVIYAVLNENAEKRDGNGRDVMKEAFVWGKKEPPVL
jgi:hypothetical protein